MKNVGAPKNVFSNFLTTTSEETLYTYNGTPNGYARLHLATFLNNSASAINLTIRKVLATGVISQDRYSVFTMSLQAGETFYMQAQAPDSEDGMKFGLGDSLVAIAATANEISVSIEVREFNG